MRTPLKIKVRWILLPVLCLILVGGAGAYWFMLRNSAAAPLTLQTESSSSHTTADVGLSGQWVVVRGTGTDSTTAGYRVNERVFGVGTDTATGRTHDVTGSVTVLGHQVTSARFTVDMTTLKSNKSLRDAVLKTNAIQTTKYPTTTFVLTKPIALSDMDLGAIYKADARGNLKLHGVTRSVSVTVQFEPTKNGVLVLADMPIEMADYSIKPPDVAGIVSVDNHGSFELLADLAKQPSVG